MDVKRTILAVALSFAVLFLWQTYFMPKPPVNPQAPAAATQAASDNAAESKADAATPESTPMTMPVEEVIPAQAIVKTSISNELISISLTNLGGKIESSTLKEYNDAAGPKGKPLVLMPEEISAAGQTTLAASGLTNNVLYQLVEATPTKAIYAYQTPGGIKIEKEYTLEPGHYDLELKVTIYNVSQNVVTDSLTYSTVQDFTSKESSNYVFSGPIYYTGADLEEVALDDAAKNPKSEGAVKWTGITEKYFMMVTAPEDGKAAGAKLSTVGGNDKVIRISMDTDAFTLTPGTAKAFSSRIYVGPKLASLMKPVGLELEAALNYGWFDAIARPLLALLNLLYGLVGNYGIAILILTAMIKGVFWPLSAKSYSSMAKMKELQPKVQALKEKYSKDTKRLNEEMAHLYKTYKVNPLSGCLPMLVQIPVFFALYRVLLYSIELRHAPFVFWLQDLSAPDPYYITPVVMGASMFIQQKMAPTAGTSEGQMKFMLYGMPILFTWLFKDFPAGLVVYWLMNNVLSIIQQAFQTKRAAKAKAA